MTVLEELLEKYQIRKTKAQKSEFIEYVRRIAAERGYACKVEGKGDSVRNIVIGDLGRAKVVYTAHYDTPPVMPLPNLVTPKSFLLYFLYQLLITAVMLVIPIGAGLLLNGLGASVELAYFSALILFYVELFLMMLGPANRHNANDNTSGVATVLQIMERASGGELPVAFVLFDLEERGLVGSRLFAKAHGTILGGKLILNFDCVGDGGEMLFVARKGAREDMAKIESAFRPTSDFNCHYELRGVFYPSDQGSFKRAVGVAAMKRSRLGILYTDKIHTPADKVCEVGNIEYLVDGSIRLAEGICD